MGPVILSLSPQKKQHHLFFQLQDHLILTQLVVSNPSCKLIRGRNNLE